MNTENGKVKTENGKVKTENGKVKTENGKVKTENGKVKTENGKVRGTLHSLRDSSPINKGAKKFTVLLKRSRGVGRIT